MHVVSSHTLFNPGAVGRGEGWGTRPFVSLRKTGFLGMRGHLWMNIWICLIHVPPPQSWTCTQFYILENLLFSLSHTISIRLYLGFSVRSSVCFFKVCSPRWGGGGAWQLCIRGMCIVYTRGWIFGRLRGENRFLELRRKQVWIL